MFALKCFGKKTIAITTYMESLKRIDNEIMVKIKGSSRQIQSITETARYANSHRRKFLAHRRLLLKKHIERLEKRRSMVLQRQMQLETMHLNEMQVKAFDTLAKAYKTITRNPQEVEGLLDKLEGFSQDFEEINDMLTNDMDGGNFNVGDDAILQELESLEAESLIEKLPDVPVGNSKNTEMYISPLATEGKRVQCTVDTLQTVSLA